MPGGQADSCLANWGRDFFLEGFGPVRYEQLRLKNMPSERSIAWLGCLLLGLLALAGCASHPPTTEWPGATSFAPAHHGGPSPSTNPNPAPVSAPPIIVTPAQGNTGRITSINSTVRYVVVSYAVGIPLPPVEQRLSVYRAGLKVAELKVSGPSRDTHTVADIVAGDCKVGDEVRVD